MYNLNKELQWEKEKKITFKYSLYSSSNFLPQILIPPFPEPDVIKEMGLGRRGRNRHMDQVGSKIKAQSQQHNPKVLSPPIPKKTKK